MLRAIYKSDLLNNQCDVYELNVTNQKFEMLTDNSISYPATEVFSDSDFIVFAVKDEDIDLLIRL